MTVRPVRLLLLFIAAAVGLLSGPRAAEAQATPPPVTPQVQAAAQASTRLRVFLDCDCFSQFIREEIEWVDFVRQPQDADVHVLSASNSTGGGGEETVLRFVGLGRFQGVNAELKSITLTGDTENVRRQKMLRTITVGLLGYVERAGGGGDLRISVEAREASRG